MNQELFEYMQNEHNVTLKQQDMQEIIRIVQSTPTESKSGGTFVPCDENDPQRCGSYTSNDWQSLCYVKPTPVIEPSIEKRFAVVGKGGRMDELSTQLFESVKALLFLTEKSGEVVDGFRSREIMLEIKRIVIEIGMQSPSTNTDVGSEVFSPYVPDGNINDCPY